MRGMFISRRELAEWVNRNSGFVYGLCCDGTSEFYESRAKTAEFLGTTARTSL